MTPGYKTTEFWSKVVFVILGLLNESGYLGTPIPTEKVMGLAVPVITYIITRSALKAFGEFINAKPVDPKKLND